MEFLKLACNGCGAPLEIPRGTRFLTCSYCNSSLEVQEAGGAAFTRVLEEVARRAEKIEGDVETIKLQNELARLDREWLAERERYMIRGRHGTHEPSHPGLYVTTGLVCVLLGLSCTLGSLDRKFVGCGLPFGGLLVLVGIVAGFVNASKARSFRARRADYEARRRELAAQLDRRS